MLNKEIREIQAVYESMINEANIRKLDIKKIKGVLSEPARMKDGIWEPIIASKTKLSYGDQVLIKRGMDYLKIPLTDAIYYLLGQTVKSEMSLLYFDSVDMIWDEDVILKGALADKYTLDDLVKVAKKYIAA